MKVPSARIGGTLFMGGCQVIIHKAKPWTIVGSVLHILDTIESESTTRFKNRSSDRMMTSD
jgi:hypothetical protein